MKVSCRSGIFELILNSPIEAFLMNTILNLHSYFSEKLDDYESS